MSDASDDFDDDQGSGDDYAPDEEEQAEGSDKDGTLPSDAEDLEDDRVTASAPFLTTESPRPPVQTPGKPVELPRSPILSQQAASPALNGPPPTSSLDRLAANAPATTSTKLAAVRKINEQRVDCILAINEELLRRIAGLSLDTARETCLLLLARVNSNLSYLMQMENKGKTGDATQPIQQIELQPPKDQLGKIEQLYAHLRELAAALETVYRGQSSAVLLNGEINKRSNTPVGDTSPAKRQKLEGEIAAATTPPAVSQPYQQVPSRPQSRQAGRVANQPNVNSPLSNVTTSSMYAPAASAAVANAASPRAPYNPSMIGPPTRASPVLSAAQPRPPFAMSGNQSPNYGGGVAQANNYRGAMENRPMSRNAVQQQPQQMVPSAWQQQQQQQQQAQAGNRPAPTPQQIRMAQELQSLRNEIERLRTVINGPQFGQFTSVQQSQLRHRLNELHQQQNAMVSALRDMGLVSREPSAAPQKQQTYPGARHAPPQQHPQASIGLGHPPAQQQMPFPVVQSGGPSGYTYAQQPAQAPAGHFAIPTALASNASPYHPAGSPPYHAPSPAQSAGSPSASAMAAGYGTPRRQQSGSVYDLPRQQSAGLYGNVNQQQQYGRQASVPMSTPATMGMFSGDVSVPAAPVHPATDESSSFDWTSLLQEG